MELYSAFAQSVQQHENRVALRWEGTSVSYVDLFRRSNAVSAFLRQRSGKRRPVALCAPNSPTFLQGLFGVMGAGHILVPISPLLNAEEMARLLQHSEAEEIFFDPLLQEKMNLVQELSGGKLKLFSIPEILQQIQGPAEPFSPGTGPNDISMLLYTSGTTGNPKGVMLSHRNIYSNYAAFRKLLKFDANDTFLGCLPLHHTYAMTVNVFGALLTGSRLILFPQFDPHKIVEAMLTEPNIIFAAVPPMLLMTARFAPEDAAQRHHIRFMISGGGPLADEIYHTFKKKFDHEILQGYGLTETSPVVAYNPPHHNKIGTIGPALDGVEVQVRSIDGTILEANKIGELCVRGDLVMKGYYKNEEMTRSAFYEEGWLRTGDMASIDEEGYIKIVGRLKDIIVCGGENIYPQEVEDTLVKHPDVLEAAVVGKPSRLRAEVPHAFVKLTEATKEKTRKSDLRKFCRDHLAEYKVPDDFTFVDEMPRTAKGTVEKKILRQRLVDEAKKSE